MEQLDSFTMRMSRRSKDYWLRKNTNHKRASFQPTSFRKMMEYIYQDDGHLLLEVDSYDTSKACNKCGKIEYFESTYPKTFSSYQMPENKE